MLGHGYLVIKRIIGSLYRAFNNVKLTLSMNKLCLDICGECDLEVMVFGLIVNGCFNLKIARAFFEGDNIFNFKGLEV